MQQSRVKEIIKKLAIKYNMSVEDMTTICRTPLEFVSYVMANKVNRAINYFPSIRISGFGVFYVKPGRRKHLERINEENKKRIQSGSIQYNNGENATGTI